MIFIRKLLHKYWSGFCACTCDKCYKAPVGKYEEHCLNADTDCNFVWND